MEEAQLYLPQDAANAQRDLIIRERDEDEIKPKEGKQKYKRKISLMKTIAKSIRCKNKPLIHQFCLFITFMFLSFYVLFVSLLVPFTRNWFALVTLKQIESQYVDQNNQRQLQMARYYINEIYIQEHCKRTRLFQKQC